MTIKEKGSFIPDPEAMFSIMFNKAFDVKEQFERIQKESLVKMLKESKKNMKEGKGKTFTSEELFAKIDAELDANKDQRQKEHDDWIKKQLSLDKTLFSTSFITYLWNNQKEPSDEGYYHYWLIMNRLLCLHQRLSSKELEFEINVISTVLHKETPYSSEQSLPLFEFKSKGLNIKFMVSDPISDSWLLLFSREDNNGDNHIWTDNSFTTNFYNRLLSSMPNELQSDFESKDQSKLSYHLSLRDDYDLHGFLCHNYAVHSL